MSKEFYLAQVSMENDRERLQVEDVTNLARFAYLKYRGNDIPSDLLPIESHLEICELCRDDVAYFIDVLSTEMDIKMEMYREMDERDMTNP